jgi:hypothetical protein
MWGGWSVQCMGQTAACELENADEQEYMKKIGLLTLLIEICESMK